jgi:FkbM family methyltransferase
MVADPASFWRFRRFEDPSRAWQPGETIELRFREFAPFPVRVRPGTADLYLARDVFFKRHHLPPVQLDLASVRVVWDLGANIGFTMRHLAALCPQARVVGVELDEDNAELCAANILPLEERCLVLHAAVWTADGEVLYDRAEADEQGFHIAEDPYPRKTPRSVMAPAISLNTLLARSAADQIDYVKMDIEGAERFVLKDATDWASAVRSIKVEVHPPYTVQECDRDLQRLGFSTARLTKRRGGVAGLKS